MCFLGYGEGQKGYRYFDPVTKKLYVSHHVVFIEHIPFFSIPDSHYELKKSDIIHIDPFSEDIDSMPSQVSCTSDIVSSHVYTSVDTSTLTPDTPTSSVANQALAETVEPSHCYPSRTRKSTQTPNFVYSYYSNSFASFLASVHDLSEPLSYKEATLNPLWQ